MRTRVHGDARTGTVLLCSDTRRLNKQFPRVSAETFQEYIDVMMSNYASQ